MTRRSALEAAQSAIARQKLEQRLTAMRGDEREPAFCLECLRDLVLIDGGYMCKPCNRTMVTVQGARWVQP